MDDPEGNGNLVSQQSLVPVSQFTCGTCKNPMVARIPPLRVFNFPECSGVVMAHERMSKCPNCQTVYVPLIKAVKPSGELDLVWKVVATGEQAVTPAPPQEEIVKPVKKTQKPQ